MTMVFAGQADHLGLGQRRVPAAERALESGNTDGETIRHQVEHRHAQAMALKAHAGDGVPAARAYVEAMLGLQVWAHTVYKHAIADPHVHSGRLTDSVGPA